MQLTGKVHEILPTTQVTDALKKRELIIEYADNPQYPEYLKFEMINDRCALADPLKTGQDVTVHFNLKGRPWTDKTGKKSYFNSMQVWKIEAGTVSEAAAIASNAEDDDLPF